MKPALPAALALLLIFWSLPPDASPAADWKLCSENPFLQLYFDASGVSRGPDETVKVWVKYVPKGKKGREFWAHIRNLEKIPMKQYRSYAYSVILYEINCPDRVYRLVSGIDYDLEKRMLAEMPLSKWKPVFPDSMIETLQRAVCK